MRCFSSFLSRVVAGACVAVFLYGCAKAPDQELAAAKTAFKAAQDAGADKYMTNNFSNLKKAMEAAETEIELQNGKSALSRNYSKAKVLLNGVADLGKKIAAEAPQAKEQMKKDIEQALASTKEKAKETRVDIKRSPKAKDKKVFAQMSADLDKADNMLASSAADFASGNIVDAGKKLGDAQGLLKKINDKLSTNGIDGLM